VRSAIEMDKYNTIEKEGEGDMEDGAYTSMEVITRVAQRYLHILLRRTPVAP